MSAERLEDVEYERDPRYEDVQRIIALLNGSADHGAPVRLLDYRGDAWGLEVRSDATVADFQGPDGLGLWTIEESGLTGSVPTSLSDTLDVTGDTTLGVLTAGASTLASAAVTGAATVGGTLDVTGQTTLAGLTAGASTLASATITGNATVGGTFGVTGATTLAALTAASATITGAATVGTTLGVTGNLTVNTNKLLVTAATGNTETADSFAVANTKGLFGRDSANALRPLIAITNTNIVQIGAAAGVNIQLANAQTGFFGASPTSKPTVTGSRGANAALTSLLTGLAALGLVTNSTSA
jgi:hypothetical protein